MTLRKAPKNRPEVGDIAMFSGSAEALNRKYIVGWRVADGTDGTPSIIDKFPKLGTFAQKGGLGGAKTVTPSGSVAIAVSNRTLSVANMPSHRFSFTMYVGSGAYGAPLHGGGAATSAGYTAYVGSSTGHNHAGSGSFSGANHTNEPQYFYMVPLFYTGISGTYL